MSQGTLYESSPASVTNRPRDMRIDPATVAQLRPRRRGEWLVWFVMLSMLAGALVGIYGLCWEHLAESERRDVMYGGATYRTPAASQSGGHLSQPTAGAR